ncbi:hypothetical protein BEL01nite_21140 [Bradyrhizobium elkanii]|nr:hypothetical protein BEL01nite_21140 [Bradyrhizobium elkanii]
MFGPCRTQEKRPNYSAPISGDDTGRNMRIGEARAWLGKDNVAKQGERGAQPDRHAVHGSDDGGLDFEDVPDEMSTRARGRYRMPTGIKRVLITP